MCPAPPSEEISSKVDHRFVCFLQNVDLGLAPTDVFLGRALLMDFCHPVAFSRLVMVYRRPRAALGWWTTLNPLGPGLLAALGGSLLVVTFCLGLLETATAMRSSVGVSEEEGPFVTARSLARTFGRVSGLTGGALLLKRAWIDL